MDKNEIRYFMLFFAFVTAILFAGSRFHLLVFILSVVCYTLYIVFVFVTYRLLRKGAIYAFKILKKYYKEASETLRRLDNRK